MLDKTEYIKALNTFQNILDLGIDVSDKTAGLKVPWHLVRANQLYTRLTVTSLSIIHLLPLNKIFPSKWDFWDFSSVASLSRNLIENYNALFYIAVEDVTDDERDFRLKLMYFHLNTEKYKLYKEFKVPDHELEDFRINLPIDGEKLKVHPFINNVPKQKISKILKGTEAMYLSNKEISERIGFKTQDFGPFYRIFSNHTHSTPFAIYSISNERGRGIENEAEIGYLTLTINICIKYLSAAIIDMTMLFPSSVNLLDKRKLEETKRIFSEHL